MVKFLFVFKLINLLSIFCLWPARWIAVENCPHKADDEYVKNKRGLPPLRQNYGAEVNWQGKLRCEKSNYWKLENISFLEIKMTERETGRRSGAPWLPAAPSSCWDKEAWGREDFGMHELKKLNVKLLPWRSSWRWQFRRFCRKGVCYAVLVKGTCVCTDSLPFWLGFFSGCYYGKVQK